MRSSLALALLVAACARAAHIPEAPALPPPVVPPTVVETVTSLPDTMASYRIPAFATGPLIEWGPLPKGERRTERARSYDLQHQDTRIRFDWTRRAVIGSTSIRLAALDSALAEITLDAVGMTIGGVRSASGQPLEHRYDGRTLRVILPSPLSAKARTTIVVAYETVRPKKGAYFIDRRHTVWTQGATEDTRYWLPTYDFPNDKTTWEFRVTTDRNERALSNGRLVSSRAVANGTEWHWSQTAPASTYLMSVVVGDYVVLQDVWRSVPIGYWTYPDSVEAAWRGFGQTPRMVELMSNRSGVLYPWAKYDQAVAPDFIFGGMENVTATTQADDRILHPTWAEPQANAEALVIHELAHQWYGNYVTVRDWAHIWLNEGFATFFEAVWAEETHGSDAGALARLAEQEQALAADRAARRPLVYDRWVTDPLELFLSGHVYPKGATVLQMLRSQLGDSLFWSGMHRYTTSNRLGNVVTDDFQRNMESASGRDLSRFFAQWVQGAGVPAFRVTYKYDSTSHALSLSAQQVQPRDDLTGYFDADVDVEVMTTAGTVSATMAVRGATSTVTATLAAPPLSIRWDKGGRLLDVADFPRPTVMLAHQLRFDDDILGRIEAADLLAARVGEARAIEALTGALSGDTAWAVRARSASALGSNLSNPFAAASLVGATHDRDPRVREKAAAALAGMGAASERAAPAGNSIADSLRSVASVRLAELVNVDSSRNVRGAALVAYATISPADPLPVVEPVLSRDSWLDIERSHGVRALGLLDSPESWTLTLRFLAASTSRQARQAAIGALLARAEGREEELATALRPLLDAEDIFIRIAAARGLGALGETSSIPALDARLVVEAESRVITAILGALEALRSRR